MEPCQHVHLPEPWNWSPAPALGLEGLCPRRVLVIKPSALGDVVQTLPVLSMLRKRFAEAELAWVIKSSLSQLLHRHPLLDRVLVWDHTPSRRRGFLRLLGQVRRGGFDLVIDLQGLLRTGLLSLASAARYRVGFSNAREGARFCYTHRVPIPTRDLPALAKYVLVARALGCPVDNIPAAMIPLRSEDVAWARAQLARVPRPVVAVHPGAQWPTKRWPGERFARVLHRLQEATGAGVVLVGGPGERKLCTQVAQTLPGAVLNLAEQTTLLQLAAVLQQAQVLLSGDSGPMHLAAALNTPVVALFTCTSPLRAGPHGKGHRVLAAQVPCASSYRKRCRSLCCMEAINEEQVFRALRDQLARWGPRRQAG